jgi:(p)ppGpp synthase/HD superfamily hydrolase
MTVKEATELCIKAHAGQFRRDGITPYHTHPIAVSQLLTTDDEKIVALLHDVLEDTHYDDKRLALLGVPTHLINSIQWLTKIKGESYEDYLRNLSCCGIATKIKLADMFHNMSDNPSIKQKEKYLKAIPILLNSL